MSPFIYERGFTKEDFGAMCGLWTFETFFPHVAYYKNFLKKCKKAKLHVKCVENCVFS